jgi:Ternary complex associated domain 9
VLYPAARVAEFEEKCIELNPRDGGQRRQLHKAFDLWDRDGPMRVRQQVTTAFELAENRYIDPVDYFRFLHEELNRPGARADNFLPRRLRGPAHGDLHGRNVLVGLEENRVGTPALFDYENMSCDNLLGWDFVKLETELKIRALSAVLWDASAPAGPLPHFAAAVEKFETRLAARTVACRDTGQWPEGPDPAFGNERLDRLAALLLCVRQQAELHLGARRKRFRDWLHEYYFLLGCYGVTTVRFENQSESERAAALISAGVAAVQYEMGRPGAGPIGGAL